MSSCFGCSSQGTLDDLIKYPFKATWSMPATGAKGQAQAQSLGDRPMVESNTHFISAFHAAPFQPGYVMMDGYGNQNSTNLSPLNGEFVPAQNGLFGPLFGNLGPQTCPGAYGIGPMMAPSPRLALPLMMPGAVGYPQGLVGFPEPPSGQCKPHQDDPYDMSQR